MKKRFDDQPIKYDAKPSIQKGDEDASLRSYMIRVYMYMSFGLGLTGIIAFIAAHSSALMEIILMSPLKWVVIFAPIGIVFFLSSRITTLSLRVVQVLFWVYAGSMGLSLSSIFLIFTGESIARLFFITSSMFAAMSLYGYSSRRDLSAMGSFLMMGLLGLIIASLVNLFFYTSAMQTTISFIGVLLFTGLTAHDVQQIKEFYLELDTTEISNKKAIFGALQLYLDFINLFTSLLQLSRERR